MGVGFETTAPTIGASILSAQAMGIKNYFVLSAHKLVPPALVGLLESGQVNIDGFILPGHVTVIIGTKAYLPMVEKYKIPCTVTGFEPADILQGIFMLVDQIETASARLENGYQRAVTFEGNKKAQNILQTVFATSDVNWRGLGVIPSSGLKIRKEFSSFDAEKMFEIKVAEAEDPKGCACGEILTGTLTPPECSLYKKVCTPEDPVGPCMVSSEGTCAAYYRYHGYSQ